MRELRCQVCGKLLAKATAEGVIEAYCPRCRKARTFRLDSAKPPLERQTRQLRATT